MMNLGPLRRPRSDTGVREEAGLYRDDLAYPLLANSGSPDPGIPS
jgi:hypothetical protein